MGIFRFFGICKNKQGFSAIDLLEPLLTLVAFVGHIFNIYHLIHAFSDEIWVEVVIRTVALILLPLGWIVGFIPL